MPYIGPDAPGVRPFGTITAHMEVWAKLSTGRYAKIPDHCTEVYYLFESNVANPGQTLKAPYDAQDCIDQYQTTVEDFHLTVHVAVPLPV